MNKIVWLAPLLILSQAALAAPICQQSNSDPDGDGWGWENDRTCSVDTTTGGGTGSAGVGICQNPGISDPDGDGWGWENNASCRVNGNSSGSGGSSFSINALSEQVIGLLKSRKWECKDETVVADTNNHWRLIEWSDLNYCEGSSCGELVTHTIEFKDSGYIDEVETISRGGTQTETKNGSFGFVHGYNFYLDSTSFMQYGIERGDFQTNPDVWFYAYRSIHKRLACRGL